MKLYFATGNAHKKQELEAILEMPLRIPKDDGIFFDPEETGRTFFENAYIKAEALWNAVHCPVIADDSGICVDSLNGAPGIYSARYGSSAGTNLSDADRNRLLLKSLEHAENRTCRFVCCMILMAAPDRFYCAQETFDGIIAQEPYGRGGFGYDPVVFIPELNKTVAELSPEEKNIRSHRAKAGRAIKNLLSELKNL